MKFTRHAIELHDGSRTIEAVPLLSESERVRSIKRTLDLTFPQQDKSSIRIADLGCFEGGFALEFARWGYDVLGIEARDANIEKCLFIQEAFGLPNLKFVRNDVRNIKGYGKFDAVYASGILYHLDKPCDFLNILGAITKRMLILNTHYATDRIPGRFRKKLSDITRNEGRQGRWYQEWDKNTPEAEVAAMLRSSVGNPRSFWLLKPEMLAAVRKAGFSILFEQFDCHYDIIRGFEAINRNARGVFAAIKHL